MSEPSRPSSTAAAGCISEKEKDSEKDSGALSAGWQRKLDSEAEAERDVAADSSSA